jgi:Zn-dependent protease/CBS domain-containing protein
MLGRSLTLFSLFGIEVKVNLGWALIATFIAWSLAQGVFPSFHEGLPASTYWAMAVVAVAGLASSIVLHELSHSLVARAFGMPVRAITLFLLGGVAEIEREPPSPKAELLMALAGPAMSVVLAGVFIVAASALGAVEGLTAVLSYLATLNLVLAVFNLIPAFPLDGGRALRAALWSWRGDIAWATRVAAATGGGFGLFLMGAGVVLALTGSLAAGLWWILIGAFVRGAARESVAQLTSERVLAGRPVSRFMTTEVDTADPDMTLRTFVDDHLYRHHHDLYPVIEGGRVVGVIGRREVKAVPGDQWEAARVRDAMRPLAEADAIDASADAAEALARMQRERLGRLVVLRDGALAGMIALKDFLDVIAMRMDLEQ